MKSKSFAIFEILVVYGVIRAVGGLVRSSGMMDWEVQTLGWSYTGSVVFVGIPLLTIWLFRRNWAEYGFTLLNWQINLDVGIKAYLVRIIPMGVFLGAIIWLDADYRTFPGGAVIAMGEVIGIALMLWVLNRQQEAKALASAKNNVITTILLFLFPIALALVMGRLSLIVVSTVVWQFFFSGFGEEIVWRGYVQSRLNQAFGRPKRMFRIQFGAGLIVTSLLFGFFHAFNAYDPTIGLASLSWGWALFTTFSGLLFGILREKTGSLFAPGIAHGLPDAVGEALGKIFGWM
jgi:membrane protease YdiL (CAAX protease family)